MPPQKTREPPVPAEVVPTPEDIVRAPSFANFVRVAHDRHGFTIYFSAIPADIILLEGVRAQLSDPEGNPRSPPGGVLKLENLPCVAKVFVPSKMFPLVIEAMAKNYQNWLAVHGGSDADGDAPRGPRK